MPDTALVAAVSGLAPLSDQQAADMLQMGVSEEVIRLGSGGEQPTPTALTAAADGTRAPCPSASAGTKPAPEYRELGDGAWILLDGRDLVLRDGHGTATGRLLDFDVDARTLTFEVDGVELLIPLSDVVSVRRLDGVPITAMTERDRERQEGVDSAELPAPPSPELAAVGRKLVVAGAVLGGVAVVGALIASAEVNAGLEAASAGDVPALLRHADAAVAWSWVWWSSAATGAPLLIAGAVTISIGSQPAE